MSIIEYCAHIEDKYVFETEKERFTLYSDAFIPVYV